MALFKQETDNGKKTTEKPKTQSNANVVRDTTNTTDLAGNNRQQAYGSPKMPSSPTGTVPKTKETGKTFVPETNLSRSRAFNYSARATLKNKDTQNALKSMADSSNQKAQSVLNKVGSTINKVKDAVNNVFQMAGVETGRMKLKNDYTAQRNQAKLESVNAQNMELANSTTPEMYSKMFTPNGQRVDNSKEIEGIRNEMAQLDARIAEIGNDDMAIAEISRRNELQEQLDAFDDLNNRAQAIEELSTQNWYRENGDEQSLAQYQEMLSHKNDNILERSANALNHLGNTTANIIPTAFDQMEELGSNKMAMDSIATLEEMHNTGEIDDATYLESLAEWQDFIDVHKSTNSDNLSQVIRANADRLSANTYYGASDIEKFCLQAGESTAQFLLHFALLGEAATISMSLASGTDKMNQLLMHGVDPQTAAQNGLMTGLVSYATEKIGMDRFVDMMGTPFSADALGSIILNQLKSGLSEGLEEVAEGLIDPIIDNATLGTPYEVNGNELMMEFLLGGASGLAMAVGGTVIGTAQEAMGVNAYLNERRVARETVMSQNNGLIINTQYQKNQVIDQINKLKKHFDTMTEHQKEVAREVIAKGENAIRNFEQTSQVPGVVLSTDIPETTSTEENNQAIYQTYTPDFNNEVRFEQKIKETESVIDELMKNQIAIDEMNGQTQQILNENGYDIDAKVFNSIDEKQQQQTLLAHDFAKALGYDVDIVNNLGKNIHGSRSKETGRITIDAGMGKNPVLQTLAHEITHGTENGSRYKELRDLVKTNFTEDQWSAEVKRIQDIYKKNADQDLAPEDAEKEIVAKYVERNLNDEQFIEDLIKYNFSLASRIKQNMKSFFSSDENQQFKTTYERVFKSARDEMIDKTLQAIKDGFEGMVGENYVSKDNLQMSVAQYDVTGREILKKYLSDPENDISEESKNAILDRMEEVYKAMKEFEETGKYPQFSQWQDTFYSINDRGDLSVVINNGDYELNIDFSTVCKKRKMMDKVINALTKNGYLTRALKNTDIAKIREIIQNHEFEVACGLCFVDTKRFNQGSWAGRFETKWNGLIDQLSGALDIDDNEVNTFNFQAGLTDASPSLQNIDFSDPRLASFVALSQGGSEESKMARALMNNPSLRAKVSTNDMYGSSGFEALQKANPELFRLVNASGGSSKPKLAHTEVTYFNEIINSPKFNPEEAKKVGGVRLQSFSDFMTNMVFDYVQMFGDMEAKNLTGHSYTKVKEYALLFGKTGMKINLSLIPAGFDSDVYTAEDIAKMGKKSKEFLKLKENAGLKENGDYMFDKESFDFDLAVEIQNLDGYDKNVGTICVGVSDKHILKLLGDDRICMVIPYHRSGISPLVADKMGISTFNDYTNKQNTRFKKSNGKPGKKVGKGFDFNFYEGSDVNGVHFAGMIENNYDAKKTADSYKAWCEANDYVPKFGDNPEILNHPNYYKLLIDFRAYDKNGNVAPQESVKISGDSGIGSEFVALDTQANPKLAELYGNNIGFNNVLEKGLDVYESNEARQNEAVDPIAQEVIDELGLERKQLSVDDDNYGYHYGAKDLDLNKKSERLSSRSGRGTGAFGTGTYFFGNGRFKSSYMTDKGKTEHKVDFSDYNLFRPKTTEEGYALHDALKSLDDNYGFVNENSLEEYLGEIENIRDEMLALVGEEQEDSNRPRLDIDDLDVNADDFMEQLEKRSREFERAYDEYEANRPVPDYDRLSPEDDEYNYLLNRLINAGMDEDEAYDLFNRNADETGDVDLRKVAKELVTNYLNYEDRRTYDVPYSVRGRINFENNRNVADKLSKVLNVPTSELSGIIKTAMLDSKEESTRPDFREKMYDSVGTKVMKALGYEGIDVRNMEGLDNSTYGSVIYDLKPETIQYSAEDDVDAEYIDAVNNGDMETAQRMVDEAAKKAGYDIKAYHSTNAKFTKFDKAKQGTNFNNYLHFGSGFYFGPTVEETKRYGKNTMSVYLSADRLLNVSKPVENEKAYQYLIDNGYHPGDARFVMNYGDRFINALYDTLLDKYSQGGANVQVQNLLREFGYDGIDAVYGVKNDKGQVVVFEPSQVKSADPITYDDNGNVIPLSERFNPNNDDIRYSADDDGDLTIDEKDLPVKNIAPNSRNMKKVASESKTAKVLKDMPQGEDFNNILKDGKLQAGRLLVNKYAAVDDLAQRSGNKKLTGLVDRVMRSGAIASRAIYNGVVDKNGKVIGKSLTEIMGKIPQNEKQLFGEYMYHWRNVDEMSMVKRFGKDYTDKPVFGNDVTADDSMDRIREIEKTHPEFKEVAEEMWELYRNLLKIRLDAGIISQKTYDQFVKERPHYVRIIRDVKGGTGGTALNPNDIKKFKGSTENIIPIEDATMAHIQSTYRVANNNELNSEILKTLGAVDSEEIDDVETLIEDEYEPLIGNKKKTLSAYRNGTKYSMEISDELAKALSPTEKSALMKIGDATIAPLSKLRKNVITSLNPIFTLFTNPMRDVQDAFRNTKYLKQYPSALKKAVLDIVHNGEYSQLYDNVGVRASQYSGDDIEKAFRKMQADNNLVKAWNNVRNLGENIEKMPRLAEFIASLEAGNSVDQAAYDAAEVTTNFKRGGTAVKMADKYGFTFLNASVQGFDKQIRNAKGDIEKIRKNGIKGMVSVLAQLTLASGLPLRLLQDWVWRDDDDYQNLSDYVKNNYYIVWKRKDGRFVRVPKGRVAAFYQTVLSNGAKLVKKQTDIWDALLDDLVSFENNLAPNNFLDNNMFSPIAQAYRTPEGTTWYGEDLVPSRLQDQPAYEQYDEGTDSLSIAIGQLSKKVADALGNDKFQISPYKLNYILDQYSGILGDVLLPAFTLETTVPYNNPLAKGAATAILDKFTSDPVLKNQNVTSFYSLKEEMDKKANGSQATDEEKLVSQYLGTVSSAMGKLYGEKRKIQLDKTLSNKEKLARVREIQTQINDLARNALGSYDQIDMIGEYASVGGVQYYKNEDGSWTKPTKKALEKLNNADLSMEDRNAYFKTYSEIDKIRDEIKSKTPKGQDASYTKETIEAISNSSLSAKGKNTLYDSYYSSKFVDHVNGMELTDEEKYNLKVANKMAEGTKDKNGKTIANSKARATAEAYEKLGLLEDVLKYIKDNDLAPSEMGLSKTVYNELIKGVNGNTSKGRKSSSSSKNGSSKKIKGGSAGGITKAKGGGKLSQLKSADVNIRNTDTKTANSFTRAYSNVFRNSGRKVTGGASSNTVTCPNCGSRVTNRNGRCPVCGASL